MTSTLSCEQSPETFLSFFNNVAAAMSVTRIDGSMVKVNPAYCEFLGYSEEELLQMKVLDFTFPEDKALTEARFGEVAKGKESVSHYEKRYVRKDGKTVWGLVSASWRQVKQGQEPCAVALIQDITARKEMETALRKSEELYRTLVENVTLGINLIDEDRRILKVNRAASQMMAKPERELVGQKCFRVFEKRDKICEHCPGTESLATGKPATVITEGIRDDGNKLVVRLQTFPVLEREDGPHKFVEVVEDITERVETRDALRESERRFRAIFETAGAGIYTISPKGKFLQVNPALCRLLGLGEEELLGKDLTEVTHPEDLDKTLSTIKRSQNGPTFDWHYEKRYLRKDGSILWAQVSGAWQLDQAGQPEYAIGLVQDITERKRAEGALQESEARYRRLFEANPHPMWISDLRTLRFLAVNDSAIAHYGYSREEFLSMSIKDIRPPEDIPRLLSTIAKSPEGLESYLSRHRCKDGRLIDVEVSAHNIEFGGHRARLALAHDVTEKRRAEERTKLDAAALRSTRDAVLITDLTPRVLSVNSAFTEMTGFSEADILGKHPHILRSSREDDNIFHIIRAALRQKGQWQGEIWGCRKDGEMFPGWISVSSVQDAEGKPTHFVGVITDLTRLKKSEEKLQYLANYDALTGLPKRQMFESVLQHAVERARREGEELALLILDLDQFKAVNESFGHKAGDQLLVSVVHRLKGRVRRADSLSRLVGDGFALVLEGVEDYADAEVIARDILATLEEAFVLLEGHRIYLRGSVGISLFPQDGGSAQDLLRGAEAAVHLAKERGGGQFCYCTSELNSQARFRLELQAELRQALERQEFVLHYQPKVDLRSGRIVGAEALLRWEHPEKGLIPPMEFVPVAEKTGLIVPLGAWVIDHACGQIRKWRDAGLQEAGVAVNVSARQFRSGKLEELVPAALKKHGVEAKDLMIELTESMLMDDPEDAIRRLSALRRFGVRISLDDFGTGYSSLGYLSRFPIDQLKIDRSFVTDIVTNPSAATIATSVIALAHRMHLKVVAEGVETEGQLGYLRQYGCDELQGYLFSKPVPPGEFQALALSDKSLPVEETSDEATLLIVDDEPGVLNAMRRVLCDEDYRILTVGSGREGLELLARNSVQVILTDQRMTGMSGTEFLRRVRTLHPNTVRIILSGYADLPTVTESVNEGALYKFLAKPWDDDDLREQIRDAFDYYETNIKSRGMLASGF